MYWRDWLFAPPRFKGQHETLAKQLSRLETHCGGYSR